MHFHIFINFYCIFSCPTTDQLQHSHVVETSKKGIPHGTTARSDAGKLLEVRELHELLELLETGGG